MVRSMQTVKCSNCETEFLQLTNYIKTKKTPYNFCSRKCFSEFRQKNPGLVYSNKSVKCVSCGKEFTTKAANPKYCPDCKKKNIPHNKNMRVYRAKQRHKRIMENKNNDYGKNKTILLNYKWWTIVHSHNNYLVIHKTTHNSRKDIWDVIKDSVKRGRVTYYSDIGGALGGIYNLMLLDYMNRKKGYGADFYSLKKAIIDVKKELSEAFPQVSNNSFCQINADGHRLKNKEGLN